jgi:hypothetical protein
MMDYELDPITWFSERELLYTPKHFVISSKPCTTESKQWVLDNLSGRFSLTYSVVQHNHLNIFYNDYIAFENPGDLVFYELKW